ncbi:S-adenosyl-L-methionine-dependent methyltransferase [Aaosphaeria arxii CBS 175.79]|uniref:DNA (cytosine-5-)-methyltransferase n=1 Tax=Aaosphaeria arxii CBS 175.79 TaxID=1450172 RepID=A0A6A5XVB0_9PLEO|nr:S-adenosyl-L-methionine-dependent methyltransferase [Aaosphaeria arxii CBS 175.79]KAF2017255.1 S-adenosyl-L-methionine-dependent methyltransferase [Aaosphaeria arxii CBS 175.79]
MREGGNVEVAGEALHSGDFLRVKIILRNRRSGEVKLRGHRLKRTKYHGPIFKWKLNELAMILHISEDDPRSALIQGLEDVTVQDVYRKRECILTAKPYPMLNWNECPMYLRGNPETMTKEQVKNHVFHKGRLVCRWIHIMVVQKSGKSYAGVVRSMYSHESDDHQKQQSSPATVSRGSSQESPIVLNIDSKDEGSVKTDDKSTPQKRTHRSPSIELLAGTPQKRPRMSNRTYTFGDVFCGAGGSSAGASRAGLSVKWGLDNDTAAMEAYEANFPDAFSLPMNAHDFKDQKQFFKDFIKVDILHLSPPCCYWSPAHTREGPKDQDNYEAIYTVGPILEAVKPRMATLEQTSGLVTSKEHIKNFKLLINDMIVAGYDVRYGIHDMAEFGLPQQRKRLLIMAARRGTPLPPFPVPTHGPPESGLKPWSSVHDALFPLRNLPSNAFDEYHQPYKLKPISRHPYDPATKVLGCITTGGTENYHFSGRRNFTARELSLFQSFPMGYVFSGSQTQAKKQIGNAFPPLMAEAMYRSVAQTLEAFDHGLIGAEDDIQDLLGLLAERGVELPERVCGEGERRVRGFYPGPRGTNPPYKYLFKRATMGSGANTPTRSRALFGRGYIIEPKKRPSAQVVIDEDEDDEDFVEIESPSTSRVRPSSSVTVDRRSTMAWRNGEVLELSD